MVFVFCSGQQKGFLLTKNGLCPRLLDQPVRILPRRSVRTRKQGSPHRFPSATAMPELPPYEVADESESCARHPAERGMIGEAAMRTLASENWLRLPQNATIRAFHDSFITHGPVVMMSLLWKADLRHVGCSPAYRNQFR